jgi:hypothetical protein
MENGAVLSVEPAASRILKIYFPTPLLRLLRAKYHVYNPISVEDSPKRLKLSACQRTHTAKAVPNSGHKVLICFLRLYEFPDSFLRTVILIFVSVKQ